jgi:ketosteroid isomerase-like protein
VKTTDPRIAAIVERFERLTRADLASLETLYSADARFKDPFNDVTGVAAIRRIFEHMFDTLEAPRFEIVDVVAQGDECFLSWNFRFGARRLGPGEHCIHGGSHLKLAADGRIARHRDYWDAAEELYEKLPLVGAAMRWLKRRAAS